MQANYRNVNFTNQESQNMETKKSGKSLLNLSKMNIPLNFNFMDLKRAFILLPLLFLLSYPLNLLLDVDLNVVPLNFLLYYILVTLFFVENDMQGQRQIYSLFFSQLLVSVNTYLITGFWLQWLFVYPLKVFSFIVVFLFIAERTKLFIPKKLSALQRLTQLVVLFLVLLNFFLGIYFYLININSSSIQLTRLLILITSFILILEMNSDLKQEDWLKEKSRKIVPYLLLALVVTALLDWTLYIWNLTEEKSFLLYLRTFCTYLAVNLSFIGLMWPAYLTQSLKMQFNNNSASEKSSKSALAYSAKEINVKEQLSTYGSSSSEQRGKFTQPEVNSPISKTEENESLLIDQYLKQAALHYSNVDIQDKSLNWQNSWLDPYGEDSGAQQMLVDPKQSQNESTQGTNSPEIDSTANVTNGFEKPSIKRV